MIVRFTIFFISLIICFKSPAQNHNLKQNYSLKIHYKLAVSSLYGGSDEIFKINLPDTLYYKPIQDKKLCPICLMSKYLIPVKKGMPLLKDLKMAEKGKIKLSGCAVDIDTRFVCKKDNFEF